jgi:hypothetical protein
MLTIQLGGRQSCTDVQFLVHLSPHGEKLYYHGDRSSFLLMTELTRRAFHLLLNTFTDSNQQPNVPKVGRPELLDPIAQLGLSLFFIGSTMGFKHLCLIFGVMST